VNKSRPLTRRGFIYLLAASGGALMLRRWFKWPNRNLEVQRPRRVGTTFSQLQCRYLGIDYKEAFDQVCSMGFESIRLCSYWNEIERVENDFDFTVLDWLLNEVQKRSIEVILTVGMKAPRWPEFHFPRWIEDRYDALRTDEPLDIRSALTDKTLRFIRKVIEHTRYATDIRYWQVENEPLNRPAVAAGRFLSCDFVRREVELTRELSLPGQKILLSNAISLLPADLGQDDRAFRKSLTLADAVGINVYTKVPAGPKFYFQPLPVYWRKLAEWRRKLEEAGKEPWIAEAQAEPWEHSRLVATEETEYPSSSPKRATDLAVTLAQIGYDTVLLWGCEYWYWHKKNGRHEWWKAIQQLIGS